MKLKLFKTKMNEFNNNKNHRFKLECWWRFTIKNSSKTLHYNAVKTVKTDSDCKNCFVLKQIELYTENNILFI